MSPTAAPIRAHPIRSVRTDMRPSVIHVLVCGSPDRGDDSAPLLAASRIQRALPDGVRLKVVRRLEIDHLLSIPRNGGVVVVEAVTGLRSGTVVELPLAGLANGATAIRPRASRALEIREVVAVTDMIRGRPLPGRIVAIGTRSFGVGKALSASVTRAIPVMAQAILEAVDHVRTAMLGERSDGRASVAAT
jgi:hydrogenase maturation protease